MIYKTISRALPMALLAGAFYAPASVMAHGTHHMLLETKAVALQFIYTGHSPMQFSSVQVFAPDRPHPYQAGRTDESGRFAFVPGYPGVWRIEVDDGNGHRHRVTIEVDADQVLAPLPVKESGGGGP